MNWLDLLLVAAIALSVIKGLFDGFIKQLIALTSLVLCIWLAEPVAGYFHTYLKSWQLVSTYFEYPLCYLIAFLAIFFIMGWIRRFIESLVKWSALTVINSALGGVLGGTLAVLLLSLALNFLLVFDTHSRLISQQTKQQSVLFSKVSWLVPACYPYIKQKFEENRPYILQPNDDNKQLEESTSTGADQLIEL